MKVIDEKTLQLVKNLESGCVVVSAHACHSNDPSSNPDEAKLQFFVKKLSSQK